MPVFKRRNAAIGWLALLFGKRLLKRKARAAAQAVDVRRPRHKVLAAIVATAVGAAALLRRRAGSGDDAP